MTDHTYKQLEGSGQIQQNQGHHNDSMLKSKSHQEFNNHNNYNQLGEGIKPGTERNGTEPEVI